MPTPKKYERILELIKTNSTISLDVLRKKLPDVSSGTFHQVLNTLSKNNLVKKITLDGRSIAYQRTTEYTVEKGREILKSHSQGQEENSLGQSAPERGDGSFFKPAIFEETRIPIRQDRSWCGAAYQILKAVNRPLRPTELAERIVASGLVKSRSRSPVNTVYTCIFQDMRTKRSRSQFMKFGKMLGLAEWADKYLDDTTHSELNTDIQARYWGHFRSTEVSEKELVASVRNEIQEIKSFIRGETGSEPSQEKLCFWVWFCYQFGLFWEGYLVFKKIDTFNVAPPLYQIIKKMGIICENRRE
jgi:DNA-binding PadR family transcriptional regulator